MVVHDDRDPHPNGTNVICCHDYAWNSHMGRWEWRQANEDDCDCLFLQTFFLLLFMGLITKKGFIFL